MLSSSLVEAADALAAVAGIHPGIRGLARSILAVEIAPGLWRVYADSEAHHRFYRQTRTIEVTTTTTLESPP